LKIFKIKKFPKYFEKKHKKFKLSPKGVNVAHNSSFGPQEMTNVRNDKVYILQTLSKKVSINTTKQ
jgi:hypothetical protein